MISFAVLAGLTLSYAFPNEPLEYSVSLLFDGYLPVLGGIEQKVKADMVLKVEVNSRLDGKLEASTSLTSFQLSMMDLESKTFALLPFSLENVKTYFPENKTTFLPNGRILGTTAPATDFPVRLPGLNTQHIPDVTFLLLQFPDGEIELGKPWKYMRKFGDVETFFEVFLEKVVDKRPLTGLNIRQSYKTYEDENKNPVNNPTEAELTVTTTVTGNGEAELTGTNGILKKAVVTAQAVSSVLNSKGQAQNERRLKTIFEINLIRKDK